jgi:hypothetical protein
MIFIGDVRPVGREDLVGLATQYKAARPADPFAHDVAHRVVEVGDQPAAMGEPAAPVLLGAARTPAAPRRGSETCRPPAFACVLVPSECDGYRPLLNGRTALTEFDTGPVPARAARTVVPVAARWPGSGDPERVLHHWAGNDFGLLPKDLRASAASLRLGSRMATARGNPFVSPRRNRPCRKPLKAKTRVRIPLEPPHPLHTLQRHRRAPA